MKVESKKAKHRRYRLKEKVIYGGIEGADDFGERLYIKGEERLSLSLASNLLLVSDGRDGLVILPGLITSRLPISSTGGTTRRS